MTVADFFSSGTWLVIRNLLVFVAAIFWLSVAYWVYKDARRRVEGPSRQTEDHGCVVSPAFALVDRQPCP